MKKLKNMKLKELVIHYNSITKELNLKKYPQIKRFSDKKKGIKRTLKVKSLLNVKKRIKGSVTICRNVFDKNIKKQFYTRQNFIKDCAVAGANPRTAAKNWLIFGGKRKFKRRENGQKIN